MRFLQTEWHRHERDRNAWEIERAEMKSRIGRLEGNARTSRRMHESLGKHIKILESALKKEREKVKALGNGEAADTTKVPKEAAKDGLKAISKGMCLLFSIQFFTMILTEIVIAQQAKPQSSFLNTEGDPESPDFRQDTERDKSRMYLGKCSQEVAYHIIPGSHPPPDINDQQDLSNHVYENQQLQQQQPLEYAPPRDKPHPNNVGMVREQSLPNHQPILSNFTENTNINRPTNQMNHPSVTSRELLERRNFEPIPAIENRENSYDIHAPTDGPAEPGQSFDSYGKDIPGKDDNGRQRTSHNEARAEEPDGWNFDEAPTMNEPSSTELGPLRRPDTDVFPNANFAAQKSPPRAGPGSHRRKSSGARRRSEGSNELRELTGSAAQMADASNHKVRFALRGHLDVVRSVIFTGGGSPSEPEICTCGDDGTLKRWIIPASYGGFGGHGNPGSDLDITSYFTHRGHSGAVTSLASCPPSQNISTGGRVQGDGWVFSGGQDASVRVWERGRVDPKATLDGHTDAVWALCVLPGTSASVFGDRCQNYGGPDRILLASGAADGRILIWAVSSPPQLTSPSTGSRRQGGSRRANSVSSGSNFPSSPQPSTATAIPFHYTLVHHIIRPNSPSPTCISPLSLAGVNFVVSYSDASILVYDTRSGEEVVGMASLETYDGTRSTGVNSVVASTIGFDGTANLDPNRALAEDEAVVHGATGSSGGVEGVIISGYEDRYIRFFDANSGKCTL